ncbi:MAG: hypothetical protein SWK76_10995 [Actinomycetota bacterium]|nr:hypothetical protein [Actinomycetota bacterium]
MATDVTRTLLRMGCGDVFMICVEERCDLPAFSWEIEEVEREVVEIMTGYTPTRVI